MFNTSKKEYVFQVPESILAVTPSDFPTQFVLFKSHPSPDGSGEADENNAGGTEQSSEQNTTTATTNVSTSRGTPAPLETTI